LFVLVCRFIVVSLLLFFVFLVFGFWCLISLYCWLFVVVVVVVVVVVGCWFFVVGTAAVFACVVLFVVVSVVFVCGC